MKRRPAPEGEPPLPVDTARLKKQFPDLDDGDVAAYVAVTRRILAAEGPAERARITREELARGRAVRAKGPPQGDEERLSLRYLDAVGKMQRS